MLKSDKNKTLWMLLSLAIGTFMSSLDTSAVSIALPIIQNHFHVGMSAVEWVVTAYLLVISSMLLTFGRLSDLYGHKKIYLSGFVLFTIGSLFCGFSVSISMLVACRVLQALGAGMMFSTSSALITDHVPAERRGRAFSVSAVAVAAACCIGPMAGGLLAGLWGWQSIFYINVPIGIAGMLLAAKNIPADIKKNAVPFDVTGAILIFSALLFILLPLNLVGSEGMSILEFILLIVAGLLLAALFIIHERKAKYPMLHLSLFQNRVFSASLMAAVFNYMAQFIMAFLAPFYLEKVRMLPPVMAGLLYIPMPAAIILTAPISGSLSDRYDSRIMSSAGMGVMALGMFMLSFLEVRTPSWYIIIAMFLAGAGSGMFQTPNNSAIMGNAPASQRGVASGTLATMRNIGMAMGVAVCGALFNSSLAYANRIYSAQGIGGEQLQQASFTYGLHITFVAAAIIALLAMTASFTKGKVKPAAEAECV